MQITVHCPHCENRLHLDEDMRGKRVRCPNPLCRTIFEVRPDGEKTAVAAVAPPPDKPATPANVVTGSVSDLVPLLQAEFAEPAATPAPVAEAPARLPPRPAPPPRPKEPVIRKPALAPAPAPAPPIVAPPLDFPDDFPGDDVTDGEPVLTEGPQEIGPGTWEAPPVRGVAVELAPSAAVTAPSPEPSTAEPPAPRQTIRRRVVFAIAGIVVVAAGLVALGWQTVESKIAGNEADRFKRVQELYDKHEFTEAHEAMQKLIRDFPSSRDIRRYNLLAELSSVRGVAEDAHGLDELKQAFDRMMQFIGLSQQEPLLKEYHADVWETLHQLAKQLTDEAGAHPEADALPLARRAANEADKFDPPTAVDAAKLKRQLNDRLGQVAKDIAAYTRRKTVIDLVQQHIDHATAVGVRDARALVAAAGLKDDPDLVRMLHELVAAHRAAVKYEPATASAAPAAVQEDALPCLLPMPLLKQAKGAPATEGIVLALARGVLYAFDPLRGEFRWARRVGIDTSVLPLRVPADPITPELILVLSSDSRSVTALVAETGTVVWRHGLMQPCTGQPVLVGRSLLVPTVSGRIDEVEISEGRLLGYYDLGQRLTVGGARQEGTSLVYFPGDEFCVYALDAARRTCDAVLYANHPAGSLRGVPIFVRGRQMPKATDPAKGPTGWMLLCQAKGTAAVEVRPYRLPLHDPDQPAAEPMLQVAGLSWFPPYHDAEKLAVATDAGRLSLWGIRQKGNPGDPLLFPLLKGDYALGGGTGRAQVVHADADGYWVLSGGRLHRLSSVLRPEAGPDLLAAWPQPPALGSPLHPAQHYHRTAARLALHLTTLALDRPVCVYTAVDAESGRFNWQRQLGCIPVHAPVVVDGRVLLRDATGLLLLDPAQFASDEARPWQAVDGFLEDAEPLGAHDRITLLPGTGAVVQLAWSSAAGSAKLRIRHVPLSGAGTTEVHDLPAPLAGTPAGGDGFVVLPLANGVAVRVDFKGTIVAGPNWRAAGADEQTPGHIVALGGNDFLLTDGGRGLLRVSWPGKAVQQRATGELSHRIVAPPAVVPSAAGIAPRICVADASDTLTLLDGERLQPLRAMPLAGKITAGPFVRGRAIVCVLDNKRLLAVDPDSGEPWEYAMVSDIVGAPVLVEGMLVVADVSGRFLALNPQSGEPLGAGYTLRANTAPETAPVPFGPGRLLVPLNDGTLLLLPLDKLR
jgi:outer membrane protein assembly factor BamB